MGDWGHTFFWKKPGIVLIFLCTSWKFQVKQNYTPGNLVKLCMLNPSEISRPKKNFIKLHPWKLGKIMLCYIPLKFQGQKPRSLEISHEFFLVSLGYSTLLLINSWKFCMLFLEYPWKFCILNNLPPVWIFSRIVQSWRSCASSNTVL